MSTLLTCSESESNTYLQYLTLINNAKEYCSRGNLITSTQNNDEVTMTCACDEIVQFSLDEQYELSDILTYFHNKHAISYRIHDGKVVSESKSNLPILQKIYTDKALVSFEHLPESIDNLNYLQFNKVKKSKLYFQPNKVRNKQNQY
jgi:hypothetical protein